MNSSPKHLIGILLLLLGAAWGGCQMQPQQDSSIPWNRPANWEGQVPGMEQNNVH